MDKQLTFLYDHQADVLNISRGHPVYTDSVPLDENVILHVEPNTDHIVGFSIIDFLKQFTKSESPVSIPLEIQFERITPKKPRTSDQVSRRKIKTRKKSK